MHMYEELCEKLNRQDAMLNYHYTFGETNMLNIFFHDFAGMDTEKRERVARIKRIHYMGSILGSGQSTERDFIHGFENTSLMYENKLC